MPTITVEPELYERVEQAASEQQASADEILAQAARRYLWDLDRRKISEESAIYRQRHAEIKAQYLGQYIAMHNGQVVDHDTDFQALRQRVRQRFNRTPVMITLVEEDAEPTLVRHGFRTRRLEIAATKTEPACVDYGLTGKCTAPLSTQGVRLWQ